MIFSIACRKYHRLIKHLELRLHLQSEGRAVKVATSHHHICNPKILLSKPRLGIDPGIWKTKITPSLDDIISLILTPLNLTKKNTQVRRQTIFLKVELAVSRAPMEQVQFFAPHPKIARTNPILTGNITIVMMGIFGSRPTLKKEITITSRFNKIQVEENSLSNQHNFIPLSPNRNNYSSSNTEVMSLMMAGSMRIPMHQFS
mmetsp:Transcript_11897/g.28190  ORF Transcript_11897/g.28190 Transcript_11897/m.28190 type:complete len:202 (-) Transcript_11897:268-873(-)